MRLKLKYLQIFVDRFGVTRCYLRRPGHPRVALPAPGTPGFLESYEAALKNEPEVIGSARVRAGTMKALAVTYYGSHLFTSKDLSTQAKHRGVIEQILKEHGERRVAELRRDHVQKIVDTKAATAPAAAVNMLASLRQLMRVAISERLREDDPTIGVKGPRVTSQGHPTWSEDDIAAFEQHYPVGTMPRLAMAIMLYTGCRVSDALVLGRQHVRAGLLTYTQHKNRNRKPVTLTIPVHAELARIIEATPAQHMTFLASGWGQPFKSAASLSMWMRRQCRAAGLPEVSSHGLRKACARRLAEAGCSPHQIMSITGHSTLKESSAIPKQPIRSGWRSRRCEG
jgi:integrase